MQSTPQGYFWILSSHISLGLPCGPFLSGFLTKILYDILPSPIVQPTRCTCYLKLFILVKRSTCFGRSFRPLSGARNCAYSNGICQTDAAATCCYRGWNGTRSISSPIAAAAVWHIPLLYARFWAPDDGRKDRPKHVERFTRINNLR